MDHEPFEALVFTAALEGRCLEVRRVSNTSEALLLLDERALTSHLELVIFSHHRDGINDWDFISELHRRRCSAPVLVLGAEEDGMEDYPAAGGLVVFLRRPVTVKRMMSAVREILIRNFHNVA